MPGIHALSEHDENQNAEARNRSMEEQARGGAAASTGPSASPGVYHGNAAASSELGAPSGTPDSGKSGTPDSGKKEEGRTRYGEGIQRVGVTGALINSEGRAVSKK